MKTVILACLLAISGAASAQVQGQHQKTETVSDSKAINEGNNLAINQYGAPVPTTTTLKTAPSVYAPGLTASGFACLGSKSGSVSVIGAGGSAGSTVEDDHCNAREWAKLYMHWQLPQVAFNRICQVPSERQALENAGHKCPAVAQDEERRRFATGGQYPDNIRGN